MNSAPIALRLASGSVTPLSFCQEALLGVDGDERHLERVAKRADHLLALVLAHQPVIDEHARQLVADRAVHEQRGDRRVDAAGQAADHVGLPHLRADAADLVLDDRRRRPGLLAAADLGEKAREDLLAVGRVHDLGVKLDAVDAALGVLDGGDRRGARGGQRGEAGRRLEDGVAVRHPAGLLGAACRAAARRARHVQIRAAELADLGLLDATAELVHEQLHAVADAHHRHAQLQQLAVQARRALGVHRRRPARQHDAARLALGDLLERDVVRQQLAEHAALAHPARDQLAVLPAVVEHDDLLGGRVDRPGLAGVRAGRRDGSVSHVRARQPSRWWRPCRRPGRAAAPCPRSAAPARSRPRRG